MAGQETYGKNASLSEAEKSVGEQPGLPPETKLQDLCHRDSAHDLFCDSAGDLHGPETEV